MAVRLLGLWLEFLVVIHVLVEFSHQIHFRQNPYSNTHRFFQPIHFYCFETKLDLYFVQELPRVQF